jgi:tRNA acetyltransferase TAN1
MPTSSNKRKSSRHYGGGSGGKRNRKFHNNPPRGGPAFFITCESGRELKCERESLDVLRYYYDHQSNNIKKSSEENSANSNTAKNTILSLDDEIEALKNKDKEQEKSIFEIFDTGCRGLIVIMCSLPECRLNPPITRSNVSHDSTHNSETDTTDSKPASTPLVEQVHAPDPLVDQGTTEHKSLQTESKNNGDLETKAATATATPDPTFSPPPWDPVATVEAIAHDWRTGSAQAPSSRFITRMIPIQSTCFVDPHELQSLTEALLQRYLQASQGTSQSNQETFAIQVKRRNCTHLTRDEIITIVGKVMSEHTMWKVNLKEPDHTIVVEICKTLCGVSIVHKSCSLVAQNFNVEVLRTGANSGKDDTTDR